ncbi:alpha-N-acetylgalactosaminide alpha-2,6-sialyltransferase 2 isoform X2 [Narcine bancroftii]|uniref:alpha-N-acetylgalactosaminide alpha-2,6-sialyltransferase 2 isoform X2 n=1 Tax=Narcine bancroftii TaxID=1343680 RepID=UPI003831FF29
MRTFASVAILTTSFIFLIVIYNQVISKFKPAPVNSNANGEEAKVSESSDGPSVEVNLRYSDSKDGKDSQSLMKSTSPEVQTTATTPVQPRSTTSSFLGDWYPTHITNLQSQCSESARSRLAKVDEYKGIFLETVPILQWSKDVTEEAYQRLKRYNGAHGWSVISYEDLKDTLRYLNTSANAVLFDDWEQRPNKSSACIHCAVIGNGGILNGSRKGKEIDGHDYVFRVNGAIIKGYEQDIGTRTSFYTFSTNTMKNSLYAYRHMGFTGLPDSEETRYVFVPDHDRDYYLAKAAITNTPVEKGKDKSQRPQDLFGGNVKPEKIKMYHPDFIRYIRNRFLKANILKSPHRAIYRPTTGATMLMAAIHSCDQQSEESMTWVVRVLEDGGCFLKTPFD